MENLSHFEQLFGDLSNGHNLISMVTFFAVGTIAYFVAHRKSVKKGIKKDNGKPARFNFQIWFSENIIPVLSFYGVFYLYLIASDSLLQLVQNVEFVNSNLWLKNSLDYILGTEIALAIVIGFFYDYIGQKGIRKFIKFIVKKLGGK